MYTLKELIAKAYDELLVSGLAEKTVYGANWYIWNRLVRVHAKTPSFMKKCAMSIVYLTLREISTRLTARIFWKSKAGISPLSIISSRAVKIFLLRNQTFIIEEISY